MWKSWEMVCEWKRLASYTDPDNFKMYIYNDFNGYGLQELIENRVSYQLPSTSAFEIN